ncbi:MAG: hypothetical protein IPI67_18070 [Myxococcales bacterium]|nr:hypothetical protein [Myxococcales bacterium]
MPPKIAPKQKTSSGSTSADNMPADWWRALRAAETKELRQRLDPRDIPEILKRIFTLGERAVYANADSARQPGLELITRLAYELSHLPVGGEHVDGKPTARRRRGDLRERHASALAQVAGTQEYADLALLVESALDDAAMLGDNAGAVGFIRCRLRPFFRDVTLADDAVLCNAIECFRKPRHSKRGPRPRGGETSTAEDRAEVINSVLMKLGLEQREPRDIERLLVGRRAQRHRRVKDLSAK